MNRREFLIGAAAIPVAGCATRAAKPAEQAKPVAETTEFRCGAPCLQAPGETTMGVSWAVSGLAKGEVEISENADMSGARLVKAAGLGLVPIDGDAMQVRIEGLRPSTRYYYRTVTTPFTSYTNIYAAKLGNPIRSEVHSFTTMGVGTKAHFCVMNDTHAQWKPFGMITKKVVELKPSVLVWNGDATNTTQDKKTAVNIFLDPPVEAKDYAADVPVCFESGNHDFRGSWISKKEEVMCARHTAERSGEEQALKWNFAYRLGDIAMIGMDTGEDKPDGHPKWFGLANFEPYRKAQAKWLEAALKRPEIAGAKFKIVFCHIPIFAAEGHPDYPHDGVKIDPNDYAYWSRECHDLWAPLIERAGVNAVITAHKHRFRVDRPTADRRWMQFVGGGPELGKSGGTPDDGRFPTVIEGMVEGGRLRIRVHDVFNSRIVFDEEIA